MRNAVIVLSITVALLVGCIVGAVGSNLVVPPAKAGAPAVKWQHYCYYFQGHDIRDMGRFNKVMNQLGQQGFELATSPHVSVHCFKRRLAKLGSM